MKNKPQRPEPLRPPGPPRLPQLPNPAELVGDIADTVIDVVTLLPETIRATKLSARAAKNQVVNAAKSGSPPPNPFKLLGGVARGILDAPISTFEDVRKRFEKLGGSKDAT